MNRPLKFRAWDNALKLMVLPEDDTSYEYRLSLHGSVYYDRAPDNDMVLMQFTGLFDNNGKEIYEGDIVHMNGRNWEVSWDSYFGNWQLGSPIEGVPYWRLGENNENAEIIGNIYENSDLLV